MKTISATTIGAALLTAALAIWFGPTTVRAGDLATVTSTARPDRATEYEQQAAVAREGARRHEGLATFYHRLPNGTSKGFGSHFHVLATHFRSLARRESADATRYANLADEQRTPIRAALK